MPLASRIRSTFLASMVSPRSDAKLADIFVMLADWVRHGYEAIDVMDALLQESTRSTSASAAGILLAGSDGIFTRGGVHR